VVGFEAEHSKPTPKGAPFYIASDYRTCPVPVLYLSENAVYEDLAGRKGSILKKAFIQSRGRPRWTRISISVSFSAYL
jgi:hypothetical protein